MATIKDVAKAAGVGTGTVSRALSGKGYVDSEKKKQIIKIAEQLEYDPSALLKRKNNKKVKSGLIGVVLPRRQRQMCIRDSFRIVHNLFSEVFCGM